MDIGALRGCNEAEKLHSASTKFTHQISTFWLNLERKKGRNSPLSSSKIGNPHISAPLNDLGGLFLDISLQLWILYQVT